MKGLGESREVPLHIQKSMWLKTSRWLSGPGNLELGRDNFYYYSNLHKNNIFTLRRQEYPKKKRIIINKYLSYANFSLYEKFVRIFHRQNLYWFLEFRMILIIIFCFMIINIEIKPNEFSYYPHAIFGDKFY